MEFTIVIENYVFTVEVTDYYVQPPLGKWCDSLDDCYGYTDLQWVVLEAFEYDEEGSKNQVDVLVSERFAGAINKAVLLEIEKLREGGHNG